MEGVDPLWLPPLELGHGKPAVHSTVHLFVSLPSPLSSQANEPRTIALICPGDAAVQVLCNAV